MLIFLGGVVLFFRIRRKRTKSSEDYQITKRNEKGSSGSEYSGRLEMPNIRLIDSDWNQQVTREDEFNNQIPSQEANKSNSYYQLKN